MHINVRLHPGLLTIAWIVLFMNPTLSAEEIDVWLGTGGRPSEGIYHCTLETESGKLSESRLVATASGPGFLAMHPN